MQEDFAPANISLFSWREVRTEIVELSNRLADLERRLQQAEYVIASIEHARTCTCTQCLKRSMQNA